MKKYTGILLILLAMTTSSCGLLILFVGAGAVATTNARDNLSNFDKLLFNMPYQDTDEKYSDKYAEQMEEDSEVLRTWYHYTVEKTDPAFVLKKYYPETKQITDFYTYTTATFTKKDGKCAEWWDNGNKKLEGQYEMGEQADEWSYYDATTGLKSAAGFYRKNVKEGSWKFFNTTSGNIMMQNNYTNNDKNGPFMVFDDNGSIVGKGRYFNGELDTVNWEIENFDDYEYLLKYNFPDVSYHVDTMITFKICADLMAEDSKITCMEENLYDVFDKLEAPEIIRKMSIEGNIQVSFTISKTGELKDVVVDRGLCKELKEVCKTELAKIPWLPAVKDGKAVEMRYSYEHSYSRPAYYEGQVEDGTSM